MIPEGAVDPLACNEVCSEHGIACRGPKGHAERHAHPDGAWFHFWLPGRNRAEILTAEMKTAFVQERDAWVERQHDLKFISELRQNVSEEEGGDAIVVVGGPRRAWKSVTMVEQQVLADHAWTPWTNLVFRSRDFVMKVRDGRRGMGLAWDETRTGFKAVRFFATDTQEVEDVVEMIGEKGMVVSFCTTTFSKVAAMGRLSATFFVLMRLERNLETGKIVRGNGKIFRIYLRSWEGDVRRKMIEFWKTVKLPQPMYDGYRAYKLDYLSERLDRAVENITMYEIRDKMTKKQYEIYDVLIRAGPRGYTWSQLEGMFYKSILSYSLPTLKALGAVMQLGSGPGAAYVANEPDEVHEILNRKPPEGPIA